MKKKIILPIFILFLMTSCGYNKAITKGSYIRLSQNTVNLASNSEKRIWEIEIYYKKTPDFKFNEVGIVEAVAYGKNAGLEDLFFELRKQAAMMGCDAVYKIELQRYSQIGDALHATGIAVTKE